VPPKIRKIVKIYVKIETDLQCMCKLQIEKGEMNKKKVHFTYFVDKLANKRSINVQNFLLFRILGDMPPCAPNHWVATASRVVYMLLASYVRCQTSLALLNLFSLFSFKLYRDINSSYHLSARPDRTAL
jgi:hypothetical protein